MLLTELLGGDDALRRLKVYGTDIDDDALAQARRATYSARDVEELPSGYRDKYFERAGDCFRVRKELRRCVIFGRHDLIHDAPISRIDLLTCRNTIMYLNAETQGRIHPRFHYALSPRGVLALGKAEMLLGRPELFSAIDLKKGVSFVRRRLIRRRSQSRCACLPRPSGFTPPAPTAFASASSTPVRSRRSSVNDAKGTVLGINREARESFGFDVSGIKAGHQDLEISYHRTLSSVRCSSRPTRKGRPWS